jgi:ribonuclease VapC
VEESGLIVVPFGDDHWGAAVDAFLRHGKGQHPAGFTFGDWLTHAVAQLAGKPWPWLGDDFAKTDLQVVAW